MFWGRENSFFARIYIQMEKKAMGDPICHSFDDCCLEDWQWAEQGDPKVLI
jgi:hypothetical protein